MSDLHAQQPEVDWRKWTMDHAQLVRAFEPATFAADSDEGTPLLAAGALIMAATQIIDELFQDIDGRGVAGAIEDSRAGGSELEGVGSGQGGQGSKIADGVDNLIGAGDGLIGCQKIRSTIASQL